MWAVIKYKKDEYHILSKTIKEKLGEVTKFYNPKLIYYKIFKNKKRRIESNLLGSLEEDREKNHKLFYYLN